MQYSLFVAECNLLRRYCPGMSAADYNSDTYPNCSFSQGYGPLELNNFHYDTANTVKIPPVDPSAVASLKTTVQGLNAEPYTLIAGPQSWKASELQGEANYYKWQYHLTEADVAEIEAALDQLKAKGGSIEDLKSKEDFPLPNLGPKLVFIRDQVVRGQGIFLIRKFPVHKFSSWQIASAFYAFGLHFGNPQPQNHKGHMLGHVKAIGTDPSAAGVRPYTTNAPHGYHCDNSDTVSLLAIQDAEEGGISGWASSISVYNELLRRGRKDLVEVLTNGEFWNNAKNIWGDPADTWDKEGYEKRKDPGHQWSNLTPFLFHNGYLSVNFKEGAYYYYYKFPEAPRFSALEEEALRTFTALAKSDELRLDWKLEPGDIPVINNLTMLHSKTAFKDYKDPAKARHLLRLWVSPPNGIPLPPDSYYAKAWGSVEIGHRGGYHLGKDYVKKLPLEPEYGDLDALDPAKNKK